VTGKAPDCYREIDMQVELAFGRHGLRTTLPAGPAYQLLEAKSAQALADENAAIQDGLDAPIGCAPLLELARGRRTAAISVCDITRPAPNRRTLPPLMARLKKAGITDENIRICIATGLHREATAAEIDEIVGPELARRHEIVNHNAKRFADHRFLGNTSSGTPVYIDERFMSADLHITLGFIEPHLMLGFSGGRKLIAPGLAAQETIKVIHSPKFMRDVRAVEGSIADNPLHAELLEVSSMARHDFLLDVALTRDRRIARVFAGEPRTAHKAGCDFVSRVMFEELPGEVDAAITTCAGYPLDLTFYQTVKGITAAAHIVKKGGTILIASECAEGAGAPEFQEMLKRFATPEALLEGLATAPVTVDQWQLEKLALVAREKQIIFCTPGLPAEFHASCWGPVFHNIEAALQELNSRLTPGASVAVIPEGPYVLARPANDRAAA
jgi:lactate racemase